jgi:hypothetical protein
MNNTLTIISRDADVILTEGVNFKEIERKPIFMQEKIIIPFQLLKKDSLNQLLFYCSTGRKYRIFSPVAGIDIQARVDIRNSRREANLDTFAGEIHLYPVLDK